MGTAFSARGNNHTYRAAPCKRRLQYPLTISNPRGTISSNDISITDIERRKHLEISTNGLILAAEAAIDLQMHTIYSDGKWTPEQLLDYLCSEGFGLGAITDHDRVDTAASLQELARRKGMPLLVAVEISAM